MKRINSLVWGTVLLLIGIVLTLWQFNVITLDRFMVWPIILLAVGVIFHLYYFFTKEHNEGLLVPGGIMLVYGLMFFLSDDGNIFRSHLWPLFILGPAFGLFELYVFSRGMRGSMIPVFILTAIGGGFLLIEFRVTDWQIILAALAICLGIGMVISAFVRAPRRSEYKPPVINVNPEPPKQEPADTPPTGDRPPQ